jgi:hypothetical protein
MANGQLVLARAPRLRMLLNMSRAFKSVDASREWVAGRASVDLDTVKRWELGSERIPEDTVGMLSKLFGVPDTFLLGIEEARGF